MCFQKKRKEKRCHFILSVTLFLLCCNFGVGCKVGEPGFSSYKHTCSPLFCLLMFLHGSSCNHLQQKIIIINKYNNMGGSQEIFGKNHSFKVIMLAFKCGWEFTLNLYFVSFCLWHHRQSTECQPGIVSVCMQDSAAISD